MSVLAGRLLCDTYLSGALVLSDSTTIAAYNIKLHTAVFVPNHTSSTVCAVQLVKYRSWPNSGLGQDCHNGITVLEPDAYWQVNPTH